VPRNAGFPTVIRAVVSAVSADHNANGPSTLEASVRQNPVRSGLIGRAEEWPYAGEIVGIDRT
jgi:hypothetical protein